MMKNNLRKLILLMLAVMLCISSVSLAFAQGGDGHDVEWWNFRNTEDNNAVTDRPTPTNDQEAWGKWAARVGTNYTNNTPTPPVIVDGKIYVAANKVIQELDKETGEVLRTSEEMPASAGYAMQSPVYADGKIFVAIAQGRICAVNIDDLTIAWTTDNSEILKGQTVSPISYVKIGGKGYVHTGTWVANGGAGHLICATTDDEDVTIDANGKKIKSLTWSFNPNEVDIENLNAHDSVALGYYWTGAYVTDKYLAIGSDNGSTLGDYVNDTAFYTLNPLTGEIIDAVYGIKGQVRSTAVFYNDHLYFSTKGAKVYKVPVDENGQLGEPSFIDLAEYGAVAATATVVVHKGKIYLGLQGQGGQFNSDGGHGFMVIRDDEVLSQSSYMYTIPVPGYPQAGALLSTYHEDEDFDGDGVADGRVYLFFTYNAPPGGIFYTYDTPNQTEPTELTIEESKIFIPGSGKQQFCISSIVVDRDGNLYYKNDSAYLFCVESNPALLSGLKVYDEENADVELDQVFMPKIAEYSATVSSSTESVKIVLQLEEGVTAKVNGKNYGDDGIVIALGDDELEIPIVTNKSGKSRSYTLTLHRASVNANLFSLGSAVGNTAPSVTNKNTRMITPDFDKDVLEYTFDWISTGTGSTSGTIDPAKKEQMNIFLKTASDNAEVKVYPGENIKEGNGGSNTMNSDGSVKPSNVSNNATYNKRFPLYSADVTRDSTATIVVTAEDGETTKTYNVTFSRRVYVAEVLMDERISLSEGDSQELNASVNPSNATDPGLLWESSDTNVATVDEEGRVTAVSGGTATITATSSDGPFAECVVEVNHNLIKHDGVEATCEEAGSIEYWECTICGRLYSDENASIGISEEESIIPALGHAWDDGEVITEADCENEGEIKYTCLNDPTHTRTEVIPALGHDYSEEITIAATCTEPGLITYICSRDEAHNYTEEVAALGHDIKQVKLDATCEEEGKLEHYECERCGLLFADSEGEEVIEADSVIIPALGHDWDEGVISTAPKCEDAGIKTFTCNTCGGTRTESIDPFGHTWSTEKTFDVEPTCTGEGSKSYHCETCGAIDSESVETVAALGHDWDDGTETKAATCISDGTITYLCSHDPSHKRTETVPKLSHSIKKVNEVKPTCTAKGTKAHYKCSSCGKLFSDSEGKKEVSLSSLSVSATGHKWDAGKVTKKPTATSDGVKTYTCVNDPKHTKTEKIPATGEVKNGLYKEKGDWWYYVNNAINYKFQGLVSNKNGRWFVRNGKVDFSFTGFVKSGASGDKKYYFVRKGKYEDSFSGLAKSIIGDGKYYYAKNGIYDNTFTGLAKSVIGDGKLYYVSKGKYDNSFTGIIKNKSVDNKFYFVRKGKYDTGFTGLAKSIVDGKYYYVNKGKYDKTFTGISPSITTNKYYYVKKGSWQKGFTGTVKYQGKTWKIKNGTVV